VTRREIVWNVLRDNANQFVSGNTLVAAGAGYRYSARIAELREAGHQIEARRDPSGKSSVWEFRLVLRDVAPGQETLWAA
jgi:hypothetical protein